MDKTTIFLGMAVGIVGISTFALASQPDPTPPSNDQLTAEAVQQAQATAKGRINLEEQIKKAQGKSDDVQSAMRARATLLAAQTSGATAAKMRERFAGNAQVAASEKKPCDTPPPTPPADGTALCVPGANEH